MEPPFGIRFETARIDHAEALARLINSAYRGESSKKGWTTEEALLGGQRTDAETLSRLLSTSDQVMWMAFDHKDQLVGCVHLERGPELASLGMLTVHPERQNHGIGRRLLDQAEAFVREQWQLQWLEMSVISLRTELLAYYQRRGYFPTGQRKDFPFDEPRFGLPKRRDFHLLILRKELSPRIHSQNA